MLVCALITPAAMAVIGVAYAKHPPKQINDWNGYRSKRSKQSPEAWKFAHEYFGRIWFIAGLIMLPLSIAGMLLFLCSDTDTIAIGAEVVFCVQSVVMLVTIIPVEFALKRKFGNKNSG